MYLIWIQIHISLFKCEWLDVVSPGYIGELALFVAEVALVGKEAAADESDEVIHQG